MADWAIGGGAETIAIGADTSTSSGTSVSTGAVDTKSGWVEMVASTSDACVGFTLLFQEFPTITNGATLWVDVGIGSAGNEEVIAGNIAADANSASNQCGASVAVPVSIPVGSRVSIRAQSSVASQTFMISMAGWVGEFQTGVGFSEAVPLGTDAANTRGTAYTPSGTVNTKGSYAEVEAALPDTYRAMFLIVSIDQNATMTTHAALIDVALGGAGIEEIIMPNVPARFSSIEQASTLSGVLPVTLPEGERLSVRAQASITNASDAGNSIYIYGLR